VVASEPTERSVCSDVDPFLKLQRYAVPVCQSAAIGLQARRPVYADRTWREKHRQIGEGPQCGARADRRSSVRTRRPGPAASGRVIAIAALLDAPVIECIRTHLGLQALESPRPSAPWAEATAHGLTATQPNPIQAARRRGAMEAAAPGAFWDGSRRRDRRV
jgi:hypothetical protein